MSKTLERNEKLKENIHQGFTQDNLKDSQLHRIV